MPKSFEEAVGATLNTIDSTTPCGCIQVLSDGSFTTIKWGECTVGCQRFNGCGRAPIDDAPQEMELPEYS